MGENKDEKLDLLKKMKEDGLITEQEYKDKVALNDKLSLLHKMKEEGLFTEEEYQEKVLSIKQTAKKEKIELLNQLKQDELITEEEYNNKINDLTADDRKGATTLLFIIIAAAMSGIPIWSGAVYSSTLCGVICVIGFIMMLIIKVVSNGKK